VLFGGDWLRLLANERFNLGTGGLLKVGGLLDLDGGGLSFSLCISCALGDSCEALRLLFADRSARLGDRERRGDCRLDCEEASREADR